MKKLLFFAALMINTIAFSQTTRFANFKSTAELRNEFPNVKAKEKNSYYIRLLKLSEVERLSKKPNFSKFSTPILLQLAEEMYEKDTYSSCDDFTSGCTEEHKNLMSKVDDQILNNKNIDISDLEQIYNPQGILSGLYIDGPEVIGNKIYFTRTNGIAVGTFSYTYKVKNNKLKMVKGYAHAN